MLARLTAQLETQCAGQSLGRVDGQNQCAFSLGGCPDRQAGRKRGLADPAGSGDHDCLGPHGGSGGHDWDPVSECSQASAIRAATSPGVNRPKR